MSREILVITPENIEIEYQLAGVGTRFLANLIDSFLQILLLIGFAFICGVIMFFLSLGAAIPVVGSISTFLVRIGTALMLIGFFLLLWGYFIYFEIKWNGQTPGKRQQGLRVLRDGGYPVNAFAVITRNLLRIIDGLPLFIIGMFFAYGVYHERVYGALGALSILITLLFLLFSGKYQRLGDFIAGTMVVKQRAPTIAKWVGVGAPRQQKGSWFRRRPNDADTIDGPPPGAWLDALAPPPRVLPEHLAPYALKDIGRHVYEMTVPEYRAIRHAIDRRWQLPAPIQQTAAMRLAIPLMKRLGITPPPGVQRVNYADLLEYLAVAFEQYRGVK